MGRSSTPHKNRKLVRRIMPLTTKFMLPVRVMFSKRSTRQSSLSSSMITGDFEWMPVFDTTVSYEA